MESIKREWNIIQGGINLENKVEILKKLKFIRATNCIIENINLEIDYFINQYNELINDTEIMFINEKLKILIEKKKTVILCVAGIYAQLSNDKRPSIYYIEIQIDLGGLSVCSSVGICPDIYTRYYCYS